MNITELKQVLDQHTAWLKDSTTGARANLYGADLSNANLQGANLSNADLCGSNLSNANLSNANLCGANLYGANLNNVKIAQCDRECYNCLGRNHCPEDCHRTGGCMEFQPDMSIPEVAEAEAQG